MPPTMAARRVLLLGAGDLAGVTLGSRAEHVVVDGGTARLRTADGALEAAPYPVSG